MITLFVSLNSKARIYEVVFCVASVEVCPYVNSHCEYCTLSAIQELLMASPYGMVVSLPPAVGVGQIFAARVFISSVCGYIQGT